MWNKNCFVDYVIIGEKLDFHLRQIFRTVWKSVMTWPNRRPFNIHKNIYHSLQISEIKKEEEFWMRLALEWTYIATQAVGVWSIWSVDTLDNGTELGKNPWRIEYIHPPRLEEKDDPFHACVIFEWFQAQQRDAGEFRVCAVYHNPH